MATAKVALKKDDIKTKVRLMLDEISLNDSDFDSGKDETELDTIILDKALESLRFVNGNADPSLLDYDAIIRPNSDSISESTTFVDGYTVGMVKLPENFLRLLEAGYESWPTPLREFVMTGDKEWNKLLNKYTTGTCERPRLAMRASYGINEHKTLYLFSKGVSGTGTNGNATDKIFVTYMEDPDWKTVIPEDAPSYYVLNVSKDAMDGFFYYLAGLVLNVLADERQQAMFDQAALLLGIHKQATEG